MAVGGPAHTARGDQDAWKNRQKNTSPEGEALRSGSANQSQRDA